MAVDVQIEELVDPAADDDVRRMLVDLALDEQEHYDHPLETRHELEHRLRPSSSFAGENRILVARGGGRTLGLCWLVLFDPGTGLEAEIAELYVRPESRSAGVGRRLIAAAVDIMRGRHVTFACVWTRHDNEAALRAYRAAGFAPTDQLVLTWLPLTSRHSGEPG
jgi:ribosomal protein S18 acetylase RimI-like enzyme